MHMQLGEGLRIVNPFRVASEPGTKRRRARRGAAALENRFKPPKRREWALLGPWGQPASLLVAIREVRSRDLPEQTVRRAPIDHGRRCAAGHGPNIRPWPDEGIGFRRHDPGRCIVETQVALDILRESHRVGRIGRWCVGDGEDEDEDLCISFGLLDGQGEHKSGAIFPAFFLPSDIFIRPENRNNE